MSFSTKLRRLIQSDLFELTDLKALLRPMSDEAIYSGITRSLASGEMIKLKRGVYLFSKELRKNPLSTFLVANRLYSPSYVSFESALSYHQLIPEAVYTTTSACQQRRKKTFATQLGEFSYDFIPVVPFYMEVQSVSEPRAHLLASPMRALFDYIYLRRKVYTSLEEIEGDLRLDPKGLGQAVRSVSNTDLEELANSYRKKTIHDFFDLLNRSFK